MKKRNKVKKFPIGGVNLPEEKDLTTDIPISNMLAPAEVVIPLKQHLGKAAKPLVKLGQHVQRGECIADNQTELSAKIHASISGEIIGVEERLINDNLALPSIIIARDGDDCETIPNQGIKISKNKKIDAEEVKKRVKDAGIVGLGGAGFPSHIKLDSSKEKNIDTVLINGAECEPFITVDDRLMQEEAQKLFQGLDIICQTVNAKKGYVACEINKPQAIKKLKEEAVNWENLDLAILDTRYPHGAEKHLIKAVLKREVPLRGLPSDIGVLVNNVQTAIAIREAIYNGKSLIDRIITVSGKGIVKPSNIRVPIGSTLKDVIAHCGGFAVEDYIIILGGPMTGERVNNQNIPITKCVSGIVVLPKDEYRESEKRVCISCGKCVDVCPMYLAPNRIVAFVNNELLKEAKKSGVQDCIECGACAFVCPSKRPLVRWIRKGKNMLINKK